MDLEQRLQLQKEIDELEDKRHAAFKDEDFKTAAELGKKMSDRLERVIHLLED